MREYKIVRTVILTLTILWLIPCISFANSAPRVPGETQYSATPIGAANLQVENEILTFDIAKLTDQDIDYNRTGLTLEDAKDGPGTVTAEYHFYNPSEEAVNASMAFAVGENQENRDHRILVDGKELETENRYTYYKKDSFYGPEDAEKIRDTYIEDSFFRPDLPVAKITTAVKGLKEEAYAMFSSELQDQEKVKIYLPDSRSENGKLTEKVQNGDELVYYLFGDTKKAAAGWFLEDEGGKETEIPATGTEEMTFLEFTEIFNDYPDDITETDRYNIIVEGLRERESAGIYTGRCEYRTALWYTYEFSMEPGARVVNSVTAALAPETFRKKKVDYFTYTYLLSPAKGFSAFGPIDIVIRTPYFISDNGGFAFEKNGEGYEVHLDTLPEGELEFTLTEEDKAAAGTGAKKDPDASPDEAKESNGSFLRKLFRLLFH